MRPQVGSPISPEASAAFSFISGVWKRKFSWTARNTPARSAARVIATASSQPGRERLLHDGRDAFRDRLLDERAVAVHAGGDVEEVDLLPRQHLVIVGVPMRHPEFRRGGLRLRRVDVADRDQVDAFASARSFQECR